MGMNIVVPNLMLPFPTDQFFPIWKTTRVLKGTGYIYKGSADGTGASGNKETTGNPILDKWGPGGIVAGHIQLGSQTGASATIGTITNNVATINGLTGMTAASVGHSLTLSNALGSNNNGTFTIVAFNSATSVNIFNANSATNESTSLTWSERISGTASITWSAVSAVREQTITGLTGMTASSAGHYINFDGATNGGNNGVFKILKFVSATSVVIINTGGVSETHSANWTEIDPLLDTYPILTNALSGTTGANGIAAINGNLVTIQGLSSMTQLMVGHVLTFSGATNPTNNGQFMITQFLSSTSVVIFNPNAVAEATSLTWSDKVGLAFGGWILFQGVSTLKIPISAASVGTFVRGENITQSVTSAQGEVIGYQYDPISAQGFMVVMPRQDGSGAGRHGWSNTGTTTITGGSSGATVTTNAATPVEYVRETVIWKGTSGGLANNDGNVLHAVVDPVAESACRFSTLQTNAGCTNIIAPGGSTDNSGGNYMPPVGTFTVKNVGGSVVSATGTDWVTTSTSNLGKVHIIAVNADYTTNTSADGTFMSLIGAPSINPGAFYGGLIFHRVDNQEDGDVDPYVWMSSFGFGDYSQPRTGNAGGATQFELFSWTQQGGHTIWLGWRRRGFATADGFQMFESAILVTTAGGVNTSGIIYNPTSDNDQVATSLSAFPPRIRDPIWVISKQITNGPSSGSTDQPFGRMRKGTLRWAFSVTGGNSCDTFDGKKWIQVSTPTFSAGGGPVQGPIVLGPWDGITIPQQT